MTKLPGLDHHLPPEAPLEMPYQVLEQHHDVERDWLRLLRNLVARQAPHE